MPTPVGHTLLGYLFSRRITIANDSWKKRWVLILIIANLPDLDILPGILIGKPNTYHHGFTHSLGFAIILSVLLIVWERWRKGTHFWSFPIFFFVIYFSHVMADYFAKDTSFPYGEPLFWPLSHQYFISAQPFFLDVSKSNELSNFFPSLFCAHNGKAILIEIGLFLLLFLLAQIFAIAWRKINS